MQRNNHLIQRSDLLAIIVEKIETFYPEDISLLICYGSFVTGEYGGMSDIDFFFVPKTERGYEVGHQFILDDIGYDLWPVSWERLEKLSSLEDQPASLLMDGEVLFASSEEDLRKLEDLKNNFQQNLNNEAVVRKMSVKYMEKAKAIFFDLQDPERNRVFIDAINIAETLLVATAILNRTYIKKGLKRIEKELERFSLVPAGFLETCRALFKTNNQAQVRQIAHELIVATDKLWRSKFEHGNENMDPAELMGFYEEFKSTYNKLLLACAEKNYENAYYAGFMIDRETQFFLTGYTGPGIFPDMINEVLSNDFANMRVSCLEHEQQLVKLLEQNGIRINAYRDCLEFRQHFLEKTT